MAWFLFQVVPGETALAFYTATNPTDEPITGISTYNVIPFEAGQYFNKIQVRKSTCLNYADEFRRTSCQQLPKMLGKEVMRRGGHLGGIVTWEGWSPRRGGYLGGVSNTVI